jgi:hypothetical protein
VSDALGLTALGPCRVVQSWYKSVSDKLRTFGRWDERAMKPGDKVGFTSRSFRYWLHHERLHVGRHQQCEERNLLRLQHLEVIREVSDVSDPQMTSFQRGMIKQLLKVRDPVVIGASRDPSTAT